MTKKIEKIENVFTLTVQALVKSIIAKISSSLYKGYIYDSNTNLYNLFI